MGKDKNIEIIKVGENGTVTRKWKNYRFGEMK